MCTSAFAAPPRDARTLIAESVTGLSIKRSTRRGHSLLTHDHSGISHVADPTQRVFWQNSSMESTRRVPDSGVLDADDLGTSAELRRAATELLPLFYEDVRRIARRERRARGGGETLQTTVLIHEAYLKLRNAPGFNDRNHFLGAAALAMRHVLVSYARDCVAAKRGGGAVVLPLEAATDVGMPQCEQALLDVNEALARLALLSPRLAQVVNCRFFAGYDEEETGQALGLTERTVRRDWVKARAWLRRELGAGQTAAR